MKNFFDYDQQIEKLKLSNGIIRRGLDKPSQT